MVQELTVEEVLKMKVADLKVQLKRRGGALSGKKEELSNRLIDLIKSQTADNNTLAESFGDAVHSPEKTEATESENTITSDVVIEVPIPALNSSEPENVQINDLNKISECKDVDYDAQGTVTKDEPKSGLVENAPISLTNDIISDTNEKSASQNETEEKQEVPAAVVTDIFGDSTTAVDEDDEQRELRELEEKKLREAVKLSMARQAVKKTLPVVEKKTAPSAAPAVSETSHAGVPPPANTPTRFLRIDNFQRPLQLNALKTWLESRWAISISPESLWLNAIKTHCYVDLKSVDEAVKCREQVHGLSFPPGNALKLFADFTSISAKDAPSSAESTLKPGQWLQHAEMPAPVTKKLAVDTGVPRADSLEADEGAVASGVSPRGDGSLSSGKRKLVGTGGAGVVMMGMLKNAATTAANSIKTPANRLANIDGNEEVGFSTRKRQGGGPVQDTTAGGGGVKRTRDLQDEPVPNVSRDMKRRLGGPAGGGSSQEVPMDEAEGREEGLALEDLFRKTKAVPHLFWLPVLDSEVERRRLRVS